ncbi:MAG: DUF1573 domain-containing protein [Bacteroidales bacterium]|nr:DUF1573 domain-containing protein [Bacteroidales bacterium]
MKKVNVVIRYYSLVFCMISGLGVMAQATTTPDTTVKKEKSAEITFDNLVHDYGTILEGDPGECEFVFKNTGKEPLVLSNVYSSCGCTIPSWPKDPIMPGKSSSIKVKYNTSRVGSINKTITVESNAGESKRVELRIIGNVKKKEESALPEKQPSSIQAEPTK